MVPEKVCRQTVKQDIAAAFHWKKEGKKHLENLIFPTILWNIVISMLSTNFKLNYGFLCLLQYKIISSQLVYLMR